MTARDRRTKAELAEKIAELELELDRQVDAVANEAASRKRDREWRDRKIEELRRTLTAQAPTHVVRLTLGVSGSEVDPADAIDRVMSAVRYSEGIRVLGIAGGDV